jgi:hypothetical protein
MSWLLFLDESGHDHKNCPYEVRGGVAIHASKLWPLVQQLQASELAAFGANLREYGKEIKGSKLLDKDRFKWAIQDERMPNEARRKHARGFLTTDVRGLRYDLGRAGGGSGDLLCELGISPARIRNE